MLNLLNLSLKNSRLISPLYCKDQFGSGVLLMALNEILEGSCPEYAEINAGIKTA